MYNAISAWVKNNLIDTFASKTESDRDFSRELHKQYTTYHNAIVIKDAPAIPQENLVTMDIEICGKNVRSLEQSRPDSKENTDSSTNVTLTNEKGDVLKSIVKKPVASRIPQKTDFTVKPPKEKERVGVLKKALERDDDNDEVLDIAYPFRTLGGRSSMTNLHSLMEQCPPPQPPLTHKQLRTFQLNKDQAYIMKEQVQKMKTGMERLQDIMQKFKCTEKFKQDIDYIVANVGPAIAKAEHMKRIQKVHTVCKRNKKQQ